MTRPPIQAVIEEQAELDPTRRNWRMVFFNPDGTPASTSGATGAKGDTGDSAYDIWVAQPGNAGGTVDDYLASLVGPKGDQGDRGHVELGYAKKTDGNLPMVTGGGWLTVAGLSITFVEGVRPYVVKGSGAVASNTLNRYAFLAVSDLTLATPQLDTAQHYTSGIASTGDRVAAEWREQSPVEGRERTFVIQIGSSGAELTTLITSATKLAFIQAIEV